MRHLQRSVARGAAGLALVFAAACSGATEPDQPTFKFYTQEVFGFPNRAPAIDFPGGDVQVSGIVRVPTNAYFLLGEFSQASPRSLDIKLRANKQGDGISTLAQHYYVATIGNLPSGNYDLKLTYIIERDATDSSVVLQQTITVR